MAVKEKKYKAYVITTTAGPSQVKKFLGGLESSHMKELKMAGKPKCGGNWCGTGKSIACSRGLCC